jgi:hypothetical protein
MQTAPNEMCDFKGVYYDARCLLQHTDPYKPGAPLHLYLEEGNTPLQSVRGLRQALSLDTNLPTTSIFVAPFAMLPWGAAQTLWMTLGIVSFIFAAFLIWDAGASYAPVISCGLICLVLANTEAFFSVGNAAVIVVSLCLVAIWCFLKDRLVWAGILCLAASLAIKPHDVGFVWLYFLLAGGIYRKRALQTLVVAAVLGLAAIAWVTPIAPNWLAELRSNTLTMSAHGGNNDPSPNEDNGLRPGTIIDLQSVVAIFRDDPHIYNPVSYLICGALLLAWAVRTLKVRFSRTHAWLALAAVVPLTLLVTYHQCYDAKILLLAVPACAMLWTEGGPMRWLALLVTFAGFVFTADIPLLILPIFTGKLHISTAEFSGQILTVVLMRPTQLSLLAMGIFYLWIYMRREPERA